VSILRLEGETADVKVPSQHLSEMVEENHGNPVDLISVGSDSKHETAEIRKLVQNTSLLLSVREQKQLW
jgi:hypothetical protein